MSIRSARGKGGLGVGGIVTSNSNTLRTQHSHQQQQIVTNTSNNIINHVVSTNNSTLVPVNTSLSSAFPSPSSSHPSPLISSMLPLSSSSIAPTQVLSTSTETPQFQVTSFKEIMKQKKLAKQQLLMQQQQINNTQTNNQHSPVLTSNSNPVISSSSSLSSTLSSLSSSSSSSPPSAAVLLAEKRQQLLASVAAKKAADKQKQQQTNKQLTTPNILSAPIPAPVSAIIPEHAHTSTSISMSRLPVPTTSKLKSTQTPMTTLSSIVNDKHSPSLININENKFDKVSRSPLANSRNISINNNTKEKDIPSKAHPSSGNIESKAVSADLVNQLAKQSTSLPANKPKVEPQAQPQLQPQLQMIRTKPKTKLTETPNITSTATNILAPLSSSLLTLSSPSTTTTSLVSTTTTSPSVSSTDISSANVSTSPILFSSPSIPSIPIRRSIRPAQVRQLTSAFPISSLISSAKDSSIVSSDVSIPPSAPHQNQVQEQNSQSQPPPKKLKRKLDSNTSNPSSLSSSSSSSTSSSSLSSSSPSSASSLSLPQTTSGLSRESLKPVTSTSSHTAYSPSPPQQDSTRDVGNTVDKYVNPSVSSSSSSLLSSTKSVGSKTEINKNNKAEKFNRKPVVNIAQHDHHDKQINTNINNTNINNKLSNTNGFINNDSINSAIHSPMDTSTEFNFSISDNTSFSPSLPSLPSPNQNSGLILARLSDIDKQIDILSTELLITNSAKQQNEIPNSNNNTNNSKDLFVVPIMTREDEDELIRQVELIIQQE